MDLTERVERLETLLAEQQDRGLAAEIVAHLFYARLLNVSEMLGDPMDLDLSIARLTEDMAEARDSALTPTAAASWGRVGQRAISLIEQIRDVRRALRPANENGAD
ncbi:hypothetical protein V7S57_00730 [Caulobacter sp. CCNWLY153]|uniref:Uncharacterized protein n=1 Tax=Caulobacter radicis TaxID=2172650 RepID=A0A2T9J7N2_9CAUL|nr:hypothetical protein [Caulobacter radicis]PVM77523.1 hypothetical protein DDF65_16500 [Caulobacter radicis]